MRSMNDRQAQYGFRRKQFMRPIVLKARGLKKYYRSGENVTKALDGIDLDICYGEFAAIVGTSGSGKSTLLHMLGGLDSPTEGTVQVGDKELTSMNDEELAVFRRRSIGFVFQQYNLVQTLNVRENIILPVLLDGGTIDEDYCREIVTLLKIDEKDPEDMVFEPQNLAKLIGLVDGGIINRTVAKTVFEEIFARNIDPEVYVEEMGLKMVNDEEALRKTAMEILEDNPQSVTDYRNGKEKAMGFLVGQTMRAMKGKADPAMVNKIIKELLTKSV